jgi:hypothetical protein
MRGSEWSCAQASCLCYVSLLSTLPEISSWMIPSMKTLITTLVIIVLSFTTLPAKDGTFTSVIIPDGGQSLRLDLSAHQWIKITNFTQNPVDDATPPMPAGVAVFKGDAALWVLFATDPRTHAAHEDVFIGGPAIVVVAPPVKTKTNGGAIVFLTYERGSD